MEDSPRQRHYLRGIPLAHSSSSSKRWKKAKIVDEAREAVDRSRTAYRRPSLPIITTSTAPSPGPAAPAIDAILPGIDPGDDRSTTPPPSHTPSDPSSPQSPSRSRPLAWRSQSNEESPRSNGRSGAQRRLRTRTLDDDAARMEFQRLNILQDRSLAATGLWGRPASRGSTTARSGFPTPPATNNKFRTGARVAAWDIDAMHRAMVRTRGRMQGHVAYRWGYTREWTTSYCCINDRCGSLIYEKATQVGTDNVLIYDLRGCVVRVSFTPDQRARILNIRPLGMNVTLHLCPRPAADFEDWFAAVLCWQNLRHQQLPTVDVMPETPVQSPSSSLSYSSSSARVMRDKSAIIKVGKMLTYAVDDSTTTPASKPKKSAATSSSTPQSTPWKEVSCVLKDNGKLNLHISHDSTTVAVVWLSRLPRGAVQRLEPSALDASHCLALYPQYALSRNAASQVRPVVLRLDSRIQQEVWFVLCRAFTASVVYTSLRDPPVDSLQSPEVLPGLVRRSTSLADCRIERSLHLSINEITFRRHSSTAYDSQHPPYILSGLNAIDTGAYCVRILLDGQIRAKTSIKYAPSHAPSWYEKFDFVGLPNTSTDVKLIVTRIPDSGTSTIRSGDDGLHSHWPNEGVHCGEMQVQLDSSATHEGRIPLLNRAGEAVGDIRVRWHRDEAVVLVDSEYSLLSEILHHFSNCITMEIAERIPTDLLPLAQCLDNIFQVSDQASEWLMSLAEEEVDGIQPRSETAPIQRVPGSRFNRRAESDESGDSTHSAAATREATLRGLTKAVSGEVSLLFRGNTLFTKAMDVHMKRLGKEYLEETLGAKLHAICRDDWDCEVDPNRAPPDHDFARSQRLLMQLTEEVWTLIEQSASRCPVELRLILRHVRACTEARYGDLSRNVKYSSVSGFLFLRFFCPAIYSPRLFHLVPDTPRPNAHRTFTLIAKTLQALANMVSLGQKEPWMEPMNAFVTQHRTNFKTFIDAICSAPADRNAATLATTSPSYSTPLAIFTRISPAAREGFPSLPYLIDHAAAFASLVNLWLDSYAETLRKPLSAAASTFSATNTSSKPPLRSALPQPSMSPSHAPLEGDLLRFHTICVDLRQRTIECAQAIEQLQRDALAEQDAQDAIGTSKIRVQRPVRSSTIRQVNNASKRQSRAYIDDDLDDLDEDKASESDSDSDIRETGNEDEDTAGSDSDSDDELIDTRTARWHALVERLHTNPGSFLDPSLSLDSTPSTIPSTVSLLATAPRSITSSSRQASGRPASARPASAGTADALAVSFGPSSAPSKPAFPGTNDTLGPRYARHIPITVGDSDGAVPAESNGRPTGPRAIRRIISDGSIDPGPLTDDEADPDADADADISTRTNGHSGNSTSNSSPYTGVNFSHRYVQHGYSQSPSSATATAGTTAVPRDPVLLTPVERNSDIDREIDRELERELDRELEREQGSGRDMDLDWHTGLAHPRPTFQSSAFGLAYSEQRYVPSPGPGATGAARAKMGSSGGDGLNTGASPGGLNLNANRRGSAGELGVGEEGKGKRGIFSRRRKKEKE